jgi:hypothetical protein
MKLETFPPARGIPMELLTERGLHSAFLDLVEESRREGLPVVIDRNGVLAEVMPDQLGAEIAFARERIADLTAEIEERERLRDSLAAPRIPFSGTREHLKTMPTWSGGPTADEIVREDRDARGWYSFPDSSKPLNRTIICLEFNF